MKIYSKNIINAYLEDAFGKNGTEFIEAKKPSRSFHLAWEGLPVDTKSLALIFTDEDAIPVCGFSWIHWTVCDIDPALGALPENASQEMDLIQGVTSWSSGIISQEWQLSIDADANYGGCAPPDKDHRYTLEVYALDKKLHLKPGFYKNELVWAMEGHILEKAKLYFRYRQ
jgi:Raf kinase inhibitor-like YbhB/YbcL family protein